MQPDRPTSPKQVDLEPRDYRVTKAPREPGQPFFQKGGLFPSR